MRLRESQKLRVRKMNIEHVNIALTVMRRVRDEGYRFDMKSYQECVRGAAVKTSEADLCDCGSAACFAGWLAVSPEFQAIGGGVDNTGIPTYKDEDDAIESGADVIGRFFDIDHWDADNLIYPDHYALNRGIKPQDVIDKLEALLEANSVS